MNVAIGIAIGVGVIAILVVLVKKGMLSGTGSVDDFVDDDLD